MTCEEVDTMIEDKPTGNNARHYVFTRFVLREPPKDALWLAVIHGDGPLPLHAMHYIQDNWEEDVTA